MCTYLHAIFAGVQGAQILGLEAVVQLVIKVMRTEPESTAREKVLFAPHHLFTLRLLNTPHLTSSRGATGFVWLLSC